MSEATVVLFARIPLGLHQEIADVAREQCVSMRVAAQLLLTEALQARGMRAADTAAGKVVRNRGKGHLR